RQCHFSGKAGHLSLNRRLVQLHRLDDSLPANLQASSPVSQNPGSVRTWAVPCFGFPTTKLSRPPRRPRSRRTTEQRDELAALHAHSITSSARASRLSGKVSPSALAVLRLITVSYFTGACTGRSPGFLPLRMRST